ncbi:dihydrolipoamide acetyltransferase family protein [Paeniglutamicibacter cryotolerans]|uniref:Dihydrolipoamide acetyltransferase component of pyruvate dehydrogenase complex n=1 Tax=Paeniglutamicibacter cryotolerans TaxID=670079 RepID=A0A839QVU7_9MICC|nr:dihydrolipoamide acetyltransferase family protein [Paeniglutamicibacter cryotolerans]MBB2996131.1 pyruvate dehydrogenase E2 component (dihydrolipoamide acetyltransferase) [Paeniglutamicibacter cryotolerans]
MGANKTFNLPDLGEGLTESEILSWRVAVGDSVELNQVIAEVETAKAVVELPSPFSGVVTGIHAEPGTVAAVGSALISFDVGPPDGSGAGEPAGREPTLVGYGAAVEPDGPPARRARKPAAAAATAGPTDQVATSAPAGSVKVRSTPPVRKHARDLGIDISRLIGSGPEGLIIRTDVDEFAAASRVPPALAEAPTQPGAREIRTPIRGVRKYTAAAVSSSAFTAPHVTEFLTVDVTEGMELLERLRPLTRFEGLKLTPLTLVAKVLCLAVARYPELNSHWDEAAQEIVTFNYVNLGIAAATGRGLMVPHIPDAHKLGLAGLAAALTGLREQARAGTLSPAQLSGGTITITNIGVFGVDAGTPILNPGEAAILAMGQVRSTPWEYQGRIELRQVMTLSLSFDHRLVDGEGASRFLAEIGGVLRDPGIALSLL